MMNNNKGMINRSSSSSSRSRLSLLSFCLSFCVLFSSSTSSTVLFQGFNWASKNQEGGLYNSLLGSVDALASAGFTHVWLPPPSQSAEPEGYLPTKMYDLDSSVYGNTAQLKALITALRNRGVKTVADIVINPRTASQQDSKGVWSIFEGGTSDNRLDWGPQEICQDDPNYDGTGNKDSGADYYKAPDIDHLSSRVHSELSDWMNWLKTEIGFEGGFRFDFAIGYSADVMKRYMQNTLPGFAVGEVWYPLQNGTDGIPLHNQDAHRNVLLQWVEGSGGEITAFDFTTKGILGLAVENDWSRMKDLNSKPPGLIGIAPKNAVTFIDNHDTYSQNLWPFPSDKVMQGYVYILTHPGIPSVFYDHFFKWNTGIRDNISKLIALRNRNGITETSDVNILVADADLYLAMVGGRIIVKIGPRFDAGPNIPADFNITFFGDGYGVWEKNGGGSFQHKSRKALL